MVKEKRSVNYNNISFIIIITIVLSSCVSIVDIQRAVNRLDTIYADENRVILRKQGTRYFDVPHRQAMMTAKKALGRVNIMVIGVDDNNSVILGEKLLMKEDLTEEIRAAEEPRIKKVFVDEIGQLGKRAGLYVDGDILHIRLLVRRISAGESKVQFQRFWVEDTKSAERGYSTGEQIVPTALRLGLNEFWSAFEEELNSVKHSKPSEVQGDVSEPSKWRLPPE